MPLNPVERQRTAYHESGHALLGLLAPGSDPVHRVTIVPRGMSLGVTTYLEVITAQTAALANQITAANVSTRRMTASVLLIEALGGGWTTADLPPLR